MADILGISVFITSTALFWWWVIKRRSKKQKIYFTDRQYNVMHINEPDYVKQLSKSHLAYYYNELELDPRVFLTKKMIYTAYNRFLGYYEEYLALGQEPSFDIAIKAAARDYLIKYYDYVSFEN